MTRVVVIGAGVSGLVAAIRLARAGAAVTLLAKGTGGLQLSQGTVDILGYAPDRVQRPLDALAGFAEANPGHPYGFLDAELVGASASYLAELVGPDLLVGDPAVNLQLPTAVGAIRPTALAAPSMTAGACIDGAQFVIVGLKQLKDFYPELVAYNLNRTELPGTGSAGGGRLTARPAMLDFPARAGEVDSSGLTYARALDDPDTRRRFAQALKPLLGDGESVGLPAVLGLDDHSAWAEIAELVGAPVFEIPLPPPSVPGMRLNRTLTALAKAAGVRVVPGSKVTGFRSSGDSVACVQLATAGGLREFAADAFLLATGGFESGALSADSYHNVRESIFDLPLRVPEGRLVHGDYWGAPQPLFTVGVETDAAMRVRHPGGDVVYANLYAAGGILAGATRWQEKSGEGIALASAVRAADSILAAADTVPTHRVSTQGAAS
ncbi:MAG: glycerol-3-phosphate dehydrogenase subunit GlpB [Micropruina sp.]|uniref:glycerol-3-phosphate dehydrogenase subunit GlpB n=1 Tax=Micropruina sp. TaxID=2737536 RepID=UPI0039E60379